MNNGDRLCPNLFDFARTEYVQDAFIAWLAQWAHPEFARRDPDLHDQGKRLISAFIGEDCEARDWSVPVRVAVQRKWLDISIELGDDTLILIEDKTRGSMNTAQAIGHQRSANEFVNSNGRPWKNVHLVYCKTGGGTFASQPTTGTWRSFGRRDLLRVLDPNHSCSIVREFRGRLQRLEFMTRAFQGLPVIGRNGVEGCDPFLSWLEARLVQHGEQCTWTRLPQERGDYNVLQWNRKRLGNTRYETQMQAKEWAGLELRLSCETEAIMQRERDQIFNRFAGLAEKSDDISVAPVSQFKPGVANGIAYIRHVSSGSFPAVDAAGRFDREATLWMVGVVHELVNSLGDSLAGFS